MILHLQPDIAVNVNSSEYLLMFLVLPAAICFSLYLPIAKGDPNISNNQPSRQKGKCPETKIQIHSPNISKDGDAIETILRPLEANYEAPDEGLR